jgi:hypothetical protein
VYDRGAVCSADVGFDSQTIVLTVPRLPTRAGVDPYRKLIERERDDNVAEVAVKSGAGIGPVGP